jgi:uncharacterized membrane protein
MFCQNCGSQVGPGAQFCSRCGASQRIEAGASGGSQVTTAPPALFLAVPGRKAETSKWIGEGWELVKSDLGNFVLMTFIMMVVNGALPLILQGPLYAGFQGACKKKLRGEKVDIGDLFQGFQFFGPTLKAHLVILILVFFGMICFIIPGLVLAAMYNFSYLFIIDRKLPFREAMRASAAVVKQDYVGYTLFLIVLGLLNFAGVLCLFVGVLVTIPITMAAITVAYRDVVGFE